jgi:hypothetical protein
MHSLQLEHSWQEIGDCLLYAPFLQVFVLPIIGELDK